MRIKDIKIVALVTIIHFISASVSAQDYISFKNFGSEFEIVPSRPLYVVYKNSRAEKSEQVGWLNSGSYISQITEDGLNTSEWKKIKFAYFARTSICTDKLNANPKIKNEIENKFSEFESIKDEDLETLKNKIVVYLKEKGIQEFCFNAGVGYIKPYYIAEVKSSSQPTLTAKISNFFKPIKEEKHKSISVLNEELFEEAFKEVVNQEEAMQKQVRQKALEEKIKKEKEEFLQAQLIKAEQVKQRAESDKQKIEVEKAVIEQKLLVQINEELFEEAFKEVVNQEEAMQKQVRQKALEEKIKKEKEEFLQAQLVKAEQIKQKEEKARLEAEAQKVKMEQKLIEQINDDIFEEVYSEIVLIEKIELQKQFELKKQEEKILALKKQEEERIAKLNAEQEKLLEQKIKNESTQVENKQNTVSEDAKMPVQIKMATAQDGFCQSEGVATRHELSNIAFTAEKTKKGCKISFPNCGKENMSSLKKLVELANETYKFGPTTCNQVVDKFYAECGTWKDKNFQQRFSQILTSSKEITQSLIENQHYSKEVSAELLTCMAFVETKELNPQKINSTACTARIDFNSLRQPASDEDYLRLKYMTDFSSDQYGFTHNSYSKVQQDWDRFLKYEILFNKNALSFESGYGNAAYLFHQMIDEPAVQLEVLSQQLNFSIRQGASLDEALRQYYKDKTKLQISSVKQCSQCLKNAPSTSCFKNL